MSLSGKGRRAKGQIGEREWSKICIDAGFKEARRNLQSQGGSLTGADIHLDAPIHFEVKRTEKLNLWEALTQADTDARPGDLPVVVHRPSRRPWICILSGENFLELCRMAGLIPKDSSSEVLTDSNGSAIVLSNEED